MSVFKERRPLLEDLWRKLSQDHESMEREDWDSMLIEYGADMTEMERNELWNLIAEYDDELYRSEWMIYWRLALDSPYWVKFKQLYSSLLQNIDRDNIPNKNDNALCYQWRLPRYQLSDIQLLFCGYIQRILPNLYVPIDIIYICMYYYHNTILDRIKNCDVSKSFLSGRFEYKSCRFHLELNIENGDEYISFYIVCVAKPKHIEKLRMEYSLHIMEKFIIEQKDSTFYEIDHHKQLFVDFDVHRRDFQHLDSLTINVIIDSI